MKSSALVPHLLCLALVGGAVGCGARHDEMEKELGELRAEVTRLRAREAQITERLDAIDIDRGAFAKNAPTAPPSAGSPPVAAPAAPAAPAARSADPDRPQLDVVRLSPSEGDGDAYGDASRPVVRVVGEQSIATKTLSNRNLGARSGSRKGVSRATSRKNAADARPGAKP